MLARIIAWLGHRDPWLHLAPPNDLGQGWFAWHDGRADLTFCALGRAASHASTAAGRFDGALDACSRWCRHRLEGSVGGPRGALDSLPLAVGGLSFSEWAPGVPWRGWPTALLIVPDLLVFRDATRCGVILNRRVTARCTPEAVAAEMSSTWARLQSPPRPRPATASSRLALTRHLDETRQAFCDRVEQAAQAVRRGRFHKVVLARTVALTAPNRPFSPLDTLRNLRRRHPDAISFGLNLGGASTFVGATPETLLRKRGQSVDTVALAGTTRRGRDPAHDRELGQALVRSAKDNIEHAAVLTAIQAALTPVCDRLLVQAQPSLRRLADVIHLETPINATLARPQHLLRLAERLHPTPAVGGYPRAALDWLDRHERVERGYYAAPVGWVGPDDDGVLAVALRSGLITRETATAFVGAGIVADSRPADEWQETELKLRTFCDALAAPQQPGQHP